MYPSAHVDGSWLIGLYTYLYCCCPPRVHDRPHSCPRALFVQMSFSKLVFAEASLERSLLINPSAILVQVSEAGHTALFGKVGGGGGREKPKASLIWAFPSL